MAYRRICILCATVVGMLAVAPAASAAIAAPGTTLWGYETAGEESPGGNGRILSYDIGADSLGPAHNCTPTQTGDGRAIAYDPIDGNLWYAFLDQFGGDGSGFIYKVTPPSDTNTCDTVGALPFGDGPGHAMQDDVGALDIDPDDGNLWAAGFYNDSDGNARFFKLDRNTGAVLQTCKVVGQAGGGDGGNDSLTVAKLSGVPGSGKYLLTDAGDLITSSNSLEAIDTAACTGGALVTPVATYTPTIPNGISGLDYEQDQLVATNTQTIYSLGQPPFDMAGSSTVPTTSTIEGITIVNPVVLGTNYDDTNGNGSRGAGEPGLPGFKMYVDYNNNGQLDPGEPSGTSGADGSYAILDVKLGGPFPVREVPQTDYTCKQPAGSCSYSETFAPADRKTGRDFGNQGPPPPGPGPGPGPGPKPFNVKLEAPDSITLEQFLNGFFVNGICMHAQCDRLFQLYAQIDKANVHLTSFNLRLARAEQKFGKNRRVRLRPCAFHGKEHARCKRGLRRHAKKDKPFKVKVVLTARDRHGHLKRRAKKITVK